LTPKHMGITEKNHKIDPVPGPSHFISNLLFEILDRDRIPHKSSKG